MIPLLLLLTACQGEQSFIGQRLPNLCSENYTTCNVSVGCELDALHYVEGQFPGARRVLIQSIEDDTRYRVRMYLQTTQAPGTELLVQLFEPDCTLDTLNARVHLTDVDVIQEAGQDRTLIFEDLVASQAGEHVLELYSDASTSYLLIVEPMLPGED